MWLCSSLFLSKHTCLPTEYPYLVRSSSADCTMHSEILSTAVVSVKGEAGSFQSINNVVCHQMQTLSNSMGQVQSS